MDILKQSLAPISESSWEAINDEAKQVFSSILAARKFVDVDGPHGWDHSAVSAGRLQMPESKEKKLKYGVREVQPLVEVRIPFHLNVWELDNIERGAENIDFDPLRDAAKEIATFEENIIYNGFKQANIDGLKASSEYKSGKMPDEAEGWLSTLSQSIGKFQENPSTAHTL